jgi:hypothetical protein
LISYSATSVSNEHEWEPNLLLQEGQVYYWRVRSRQNNQKDIRWSESSFVHLSKRANAGWNQSHFQQYQQNNFQQLTPPSYTNAAFEFEASCGEIAAFRIFTKNRKYSRSRNSFNGKIIRGN